MNGNQIIAAIEQQEQAERAARIKGRDLFKRLNALIASRYTIGETVVGRCNGREDVQFIVQRVHVMPKANGNGVVIELAGPIIKKDGTRGLLFGHKYENLTVAELDTVEEREVA